MEIVTYIASSNGHKKQFYHFRQGALEPQYKSTFKKNNRESKLLSKFVGHSPYFYGGLDDKVKKKICRQSLVHSAPKKILLQTRFLV